jgi:hypothetical protein
MRALVVFDSMFGNTQHIAAAVADGIRSYAVVDMVPVDLAPPQVDEGVDLLVVGGPTHAHGMSSKRSRTVSPQQAAHGATASRIGLREWLTGLNATDLPAAAFDTRYRKPRWLTGSAASRAARQLRHHHCRLVEPPESFFVEHGEGPLLPGEVDRARAWGEQLGAEVVAAGPAS